MNDEIKHLQELMRAWVPLSPHHSRYLENHREYLALENALDEAVHDYFKQTGKGRLNGNGYYFK